MPIFAMTKVDLRRETPEIPKHLEEHEKEQGDLKNG